MGYQTLGRNTCRFWRKIDVCASIFICVKSLYFNTLQIILKNKKRNPFSYPFYFYIRTNVYKVLTMKTIITILAAVCISVWAIAEGTKQLMPANNGKCRVQFNESIGGQRYFI